MEVEQNDEIQQVLLGKAKNNKVEWLDQRNHVLRRIDMYAGSGDARQHDGTTFVVDARDDGEGDLETAHEEVEKVEVNPATESDPLLSSDEQPPSKKAKTKAKKKEPVLKPVKFNAHCSPAALNLFKEVIQNAIDNGLRDQTQKKIKISVNQRTGIFEVYNDGAGIDTSEYESTGRSVVDIIFSEYMSGTNLSEKPSSEMTEEEMHAALISGGRNGFGVTLVNTYSKWFEVETGNPATQELYTQRWEDNMGKRLSPKRKKYKNKLGFVRVRFELDFEKLGMSCPGMDGLHPELVKAYSRQAYDAAIVSGLRLNSVYWSDRGPDGWESPIPLKNGPSYLRALLDPCVKTARRVAQELVTRPDGLAVLEIAVCVVGDDERATLNDNALSVGFVNGIRCSSGTHMDHVTKRIVETVRKQVISKAKRELTVQPKHVMDHLAMVVTCLVANKSFDSQCKERLTTPASELGFKWTPSESFKSSLFKTDIVQLASTAAEQKESAAAKRVNAPNRSKALKINKFDPPVVKKNATIILTEGDSAKALAVAGLGVVGRDAYGVFPLKGKLLNVRNCTKQQLSGNKEIHDLNIILGLEQGVTYTAEMIENLPFSKLVIFTDQDPDGDHIAGLIVNWLHHQHPSVLKARPNFVQRFATPLIKATPKTGGGDTLEFFSVQEFDEWKEAQEGSGDLKRFRIKYYKGLGTHTSKEARESFRHWNRNVITLEYTGADCDTAMLDYFDSKKADRRKEILSKEYDANSFIDYSESCTSINAYMNRAVVHFSHYDNERSIAGFDGFKPGQRKIMWVFLNAYNKSEEVKVAQICGKIAEKMAYHHGEVSLQETIVALAQEHLGTNTVPLLKPIGQYGSRHAETKVHAAARYIFTKINEFATLLFPEDDFPILTVREEEGQQIEPTHLLPVVPLNLINGVQGIGTGFSTDIARHNPKDVILACTQLAKVHLDGGDMAETPLQSITPWFDAFSGTVRMDTEPQSVAPATVAEERCADGFTVEGCYDIDLSTGTLTVTELPPTKWTEPYMEFVRDKLMTSPTDEKAGQGNPEKGGRKKKRPRDDEIPESAGAPSPNSVAKTPLVKEIFNGSSENRVHIEMKCDVDQLRAVHEKGDIVKVFRLSMKESLKNMRYFDDQGNLVIARDVRDIVRKHAVVRLEGYVKRKEFHLGAKRRNLEKITSELVFINAVLNETLVISKRKKAEVAEDVADLGCMRVSEGRTEPDNLKDFNYLLRMSLESLTEENVDALKKKHAALEVDIATLEATEPASMWLSDLERLHEGTKAFFEDKAQRHSEGAIVTKNLSKKRKRKEKNQSKLN